MSSVVNRLSSQHLHFLLAFKVLKESDESDRLGESYTVLALELWCFVCVCVGANHVLVSQPCIMLQLTNGASLVTMVFAPDKITSPGDCFSFLRSF